MKLKPTAFLIFFLSLFSNVQAQYLFTGELPENSGYSTAYLSLVEDYRKIAGVYEDQIIKTVAIVNNSFQFSGANLDVNNRIYRIHIDNCNDGYEKGHFNGQCQASRAIVFVANTKDTIHLPITFEDQLLCSIVSAKEHAKALARVDSLKEQMMYDYLSYRSQANKTVNNKNWFAKLQEFGASLNEPLAELYIYQFLSDRRGEFYNYYLEDLQTNRYYNNLLDRLNKNYANSSFTKQYELEIAGDKYRVELGNTVTFNWKIWLFTLVVFMVLGAAAFRFIKKKSPEVRSSDLLTQQEQKVLNLILENKTNKEIAQEIFVSVSTVKTHTNNLYKKLNVTSRDQVKSLYNS